MITVKEYQQRRTALAKKLPANSIAVIPASSETLRNGDAHYRFRQDSDFYYLTGFNEPDAVLVILSGTPGESILFNRAKEAEQERWTGKRLGQEQAVHTLGVQWAYSIESIETKLPDLLSGREAVFHSIGRFPQWERRLLHRWQQVKGQIRRGIQSPVSLYDLDPYLSELRLFKSEAELTCMQQAAQVTVLAHQRAMQACPAMQYEYQLEATLLNTFISEGCRNVAYDPIVASGENACTLHYTENNDALIPGELVLIDAGCEYDNYAADVTRTFPINGQFSAEQRALYDLVLNAQKAGISKIKPGIRWNEVQLHIVQIITQGLVDLNILKGSVDDLIEKEAYKAFYMHQSGHWLGLDVHDVGQYKLNGNWRPLSPGMVLTVEPGLYVNTDCMEVDARWRGIGIRIEDDIVVTQEGCINLTGHLPVEINEIEGCIRG